MGTIILSYYVNHLNYRGRSSRRELFIPVTFALIGLFFLALVVEVNYEWGFLLNIYTMANFIPFMSVVVRRLHDTGRSGKLLWILLIPVLGFFMISIFLLLPGSVMENKYGSSNVIPLTNTDHENLDDSLIYSSENIFSRETKNESTNMGEDFALSKTVSDPRSFNPNTINISEDEWEEE